MTPTLSRFVRPAAAIALTFGASVAFAHPGHPGHTAEGSLLVGFLHPLTGADHLLAMVAVGVWSALASRSVRDALWAPVAFVALMILGALLGAGGVAVPMAEPMIAASLLVFGLLIAARAQLPTWGGALLCGAFALFHGYAHGTEFPAGAQAMFPYFVGGFAVATALLHTTGIGAGFALKPRLAWLARLSGVGVALYGAGLLVTAI
ncbi:MULTISPECIES: HupE/UreJ family protein [Ralstonia]|jgi:urease accessory protein|uniref:Urease accessory protein UreJ n=3 Tax=Pseudomonadota TaxID=1224 RepID=A0ABN9I4J5_RALPI|nr:MULTISPECIES: HupE/UreJ family protein [Ralstonia]MBA4201924.1 urease accessory protein UreJ [Ralstonia sp.]MBA4232653.1 urease accessory protein UreJ [Ralstonia sp.]MBA4238110.1 urease accessory protein UreJ [Ralstonia sp.]MBA4282278.1 urease accessory protein UreJ [Ralstonia sp.]MBA4295428.1 urease accessory protein UreJ [Ralstonia sp.]